MGKVKIYSNQHLYYILQGSNVAEFNMEEKMVRHDSTLHWLHYLDRASMPEVLPETEEYNQVLCKYKAVINKLPLQAGL
ncbi:hypothetical protein GCM10009122_14180 [Fulvivirga kasyanovii]|uniref:Uncharacterized protein n=1 Tax=Fulvivirga kasyanovii TaxID=396812 RepID=A0ABW9RNG1_9BACT|nr:hypothetical protein [Fulvivirga kasyanovii]MTI25558.1 hypothetical protein [Fulvivirga kasyanovii]